jgi:putative tryptophan/tyrosine transport system substrate-binding protein
VRRGSSEAGPTARSAAPPSMPIAQQVGLPCLLRPRSESVVAQWRHALYDEDHNGDLIRQAHRAAKQQGLELFAVAVHRQEEIPNAVRTLLPKIDALWLIQDQTVASESAIPFFLESTLDAKVPLFTFSSTLVQQGAINALVLDPWAVGQQAAHIALAHLSGQHTSSGLLQVPEHLQLALNLNSAEHLDLLLPPELIRMAGHLFGGPGAIAQQPGDSAVIR